MKNSLYKLILAFSIIFMSGCTDIFEPSLDDAAVELITPISGVPYDQYAITFWWEEVDGASRYNVQIVRPSFDSLVVLVADTNVTGTKFIYTLAPGNYQWRVRAENAGSVGPYSVRDLEITEADFNLQQAQLIEPTSTNLFGSHVRFSWQALPTATKYIIQVDPYNGNFTSGSLIIDDTVFFFGTGTVEFNSTINTDQKYRWRVRGIDSAGVESQFSNTGEFVITPTPPVVADPPLNAVVPNPVNLTWNPLAGAQSYRLILQDRAGTSLTTLPLITGTSRQINVGASGDTIFWRVSALDIMDNESDTSVVRTYRVK